MISLHKHFKLIRTDDNGNWSADIDFIPDFRKIKIINQGIDKGQTTAFTSQGATGKTYNVFFIEGGSFIEA
jgi:hypothetical protein